MSLLGESLEQTADDCGHELHNAGTRLSKFRCKRCAPRLLKIWPVLIAWSYRLRSFKRNAFAVIGLGVGCALYFGAKPVSTVEKGSSELGPFSTSGNGTELPAHTSEKRCQKCGVIYWESAAAEARKTRETKPCTAPRS